MKKYLVRVALFFVIVAFIDVAIGILFRYLQSSKAGGRTGAEYYVCRQSNEDIIVMGSSRASHHYVPEIISDNLGMSCYNGGQDGNGIILQYGRWKMISERYTPKLIIYDISNSYDLEYNDNMAYIDRLKPFCGERTVRSYVTGIYPLERLKLLSQMYRFNYKFLELFLDCTKKNNGRDAGYIPLDGYIRKEVIDAKARTGKKATIKYDPVKLKYLEQFVREAKEIGSQVVFVISPSWAGGEYEWNAYSEVRALAESYSVPFFEYIDSELSYNPNLFKDSSHLNDQGARVFTEDLVSRLKI